jgi:hypothetical protein
VFTTLGYFIFIIEFFFMVLVYLAFLVGLTLIILDSKATPAEKKHTAWKPGRIKMILGSWTMVLGSSVAIVIHLWHWLF